MKIKQFLAHASPNWRLVLLFLAMINLGSVFGQNCGLSFAYVYNNVSVATSVNLTNQNVRITGTVTFNSITLTGCNVLLDPGAIMIIQKGLTAQSDPFNVQTVFFGCNTMWNRIEIASGAAVTLNNCKFQDGDNGLVLTSGYKDASSRIENCTFTRNRISITANNVPNFSFTRFLNNRFLGNQSGMLPPYVIQNPIVGISANNTTGTIGTSGAANTFQGLCWGIYALNATLSINNCLFDSNQSTGGNPNNPGSIFASSGSGIFATSSFITLDGSLPCIFSGNRQDIYSSNTGLLSVSAALFSDPTFASIVVNSSNQPSKLYIGNCKFSIGQNMLLPQQSWIQIQRPAQTSSFAVNTSIFNNRFTINQAPPNSTRSIRVLNFTAQPGAADAADISFNVITNRYGNSTATDPPYSLAIDGVAVSGQADGYNFFSNQFNYNAPAGTPTLNVTSVGIGFYNNPGINNMIGSGNTFTGNYSPNPAGAGTDNVRQTWLRCGIHIDNSPSVRVCSNTSTNVTNFFHFLNVCDHIEFGENVSTGRGFFGLAVDVGPIINNHHHRHNLFNAVYDNFGARHSNPTTQPTLRWFVDQAITGYRPSSQNPSNWFQPQVDPGDAHICDPVLPKVEDAGPNNPDESIVEFLAGAYTFPAEAAVKDFERGALHRMIRFPATIKGEVSPQYYESRQNSPIWTIANAQNMLWSAMKPDGVSEQALRQLMQQANTLTTQVIEIEKADTSGIDSVLQAQKSQLLLTLNGVRNGILEQSAAIKSLRTPKVETARTYIDQIQTNDDWTAHQKTLLILQAKNCAEVVWTDADWAALRAIAYACPKVLGEVVTIARNMLPSEEATQFVKEGDDPYCVEPRAQTGQPFDMVITANPNPTHDLLMIGFGQPFTGSIQLWNASGQLKFSRDYTELTQTAVGTAQLPNGLYSLQCQNSSGVITTKKIIVIH